MSRQKGMVTASENQLRPQNKNKNKKSVEFVTLICEYQAFMAHHATLLCGQH